MLDIARIGYEILLGLACENSSDSHDLVNSRDEIYGFIWEDGF